MLNFRYYQQEAINAVFNYFQTNAGNPIVALPTGTGKSLVIAGFVHAARYYYPTTRIMMLTHRQELIEQNFAKLKAHWPEAPAGIYSAGLNKADTAYPITFAGIQSVANKAALFRHQDLVIIDECHLVSPGKATTYRAFLDSLMCVNPYLKVIGLTATAYRQGLGPLTLGGIFTDICYDLTSRDAFNKLLAEGFLARLVPKRTTTEVSGEGVATRNGEYVEKDLQKAVDREAITEAAVRETIALGQARRHWLCFSSGIEHGQHIVDAFVRNGVPAIMVTGAMNREERKAAIAGFRQGKYRVLVNNNVLTTGFDFPEIDLIVMLRPTLSTSLWVQMLGRGTRPCDGKADCLVLDFARNTERLGPINDPLLPRPKNDNGPPGKAPVKPCPQCGEYNHPRASVCSDCGFEFPPPETKLREGAGTAELIAGSPQLEFAQVHTFNVASVTYRIHRKEGKPPSLRVSYICGLREFSEYVCFEHGGIAAMHARKWWAQRFDTLCPTRTEDAYAASMFFPKPVTLNVSFERGQQPKVVGYGFQ